MRIELVDTATRNIRCGDGKLRDRYTFKYFSSLDGPIKWKEASSGNWFFTAKLPDGRLIDFYANGWSELDCFKFSFSKVREVDFWTHDSDTQGGSIWHWMTLLPPHEQHSNLRSAFESQSLNREARVRLNQHFKEKEQQKVLAHQRLRDEKEAADKAVAAAVMADPYKEEGEDPFEGLNQTLQALRDDPADTQVVQQLEATLNLEQKPKPTAAASKSVKTTKGYERGSRLHLQFTTIQRENMRLVWEEYGFPEVGHNNMEKWFADLVYGYFMNEYDPKQGGLVKARLRSERLASDGG